MEYAKIEDRKHTSSDTRLRSTSTRHKQIFFFLAMQVSIDCISCLSSDFISDSSISLYVFQREIETGKHAVISQIFQSSCSSISVDPFTSQKMIRFIKSSSTSNQKSTEPFASSKNKYLSSHDVQFHNIFFHINLISFSSLILHYSQFQTFCLLSEGK